MFKDEDECYVEEWNVTLKEKMRNVGSSQMSLQWRNWCPDSIDRAGLGISSRWSDFSSS